MPQLAPQLITFALAPKEKGDEDKVYAAVQKLLDEDVTLKLSRDEESGDILLSGMGQQMCIRDRSMSSAAMLLEVLFAGISSSRNACKRFLVGTPSSVARSFTLVLSSVMH